jgi:glycosyltransferase involved in cell wall biosynthesis
MPGLGGGLKIIGEGPERGKLEELCAHHGLDNVRFLGYLQEQNLHREISRAMFAVMPSECYENFPLSVLEAFALGKPVVGARMGGIPELVRDLDTGLTFEAGNVQDLREKLRFLLENPDLVRDMGENARRLVEERYNPESHYAGLVEIYRRAADKVSP